MEIFVRIKPNLSDNNVKNQVKKIIFPLVQNNFKDTEDVTNLKLQDI
jgi:hypothetical protein